MNSGHTALMLSAQNGHDLCLSALIEANANLEATQNQGFTALMLSSQNGHESCARALLEAGADRAREIPGYAGWNAFKLAERNGHTAVCELLKG